MRSLPAPFGPYRLERELGRGGMGVVYEATDPSGRRVALKTLSGRAHPQRLERFQREREALARLRHPHVIPVHAAGEVAGELYFVMPLVEGGSLQERVEDRGPLDPAAVVGVGLALCSALEAAHAAGILHRDLKPENVLFAGDGSALLADFGLARDLTGEALTRTGAFLGTPGYLAPEQASGDRAGQGPATDVYGVGATLYYALCAEPPHTGPNLAQVLLATQHPPPTPPSQRVPGVPPALESWVLACLAKDPAARPSLTELAAALETCLAPRAARRRRGSWALGGVGLALAGLWLARDRWRVEVGGPPPAPPSPTRVGPEAPGPALPEVPAPPGEVPWERGGLPELDLSLDEALAQARAAVVAEEWGQAALYFEHARLLGAGSGLDRLGFEREYIEALSSRMKELRWDDCWEEAAGHARRICEVVDPYLDGGFEQGIEEIARATQFQMPFADAHFLLAEDHRRLGRLDEALAELQRVRWATQSSDRVAHLLVRVHLDRGSLELARAELEACCLRTKDAGHWTGGLLRFGQALLARGRRAEAQPLLEAAAQGYSEFERFRALCLLDAAGQARAEAVVAAYAPGRASAAEHRAAGDAFWALGEGVPADAAYSRAAKADPQAVETWRAWARYRVQRGWGAPDAVRTARRLGAFPGEGPLALALEACAEGRREDYARAVELGLQAFAADPSLVRTTPLALELGRALCEEGRAEELEPLIAALRGGPPPCPARVKYLEDMLRGERRRERSPF
ncbi:MAG: protein kinase [Planctomycetota bacterium]